MTTPGGGLGSGEPDAGPTPSGIRLLGAVLAGGESRRFGRDKTAEVVGGVPMVERAVATLEGLCDEVVVVSSRAATPTGRWRIIPDLRPGEGPLAAVEAALAEAEARGYDGALVLAADLPLMDRTTLTRLVQALGDGAVSVAAASAGASAGGAGADGIGAAGGSDASAETGPGSSDTGRTAPPIQPLCAAYRSACAERVRRLLDEGRRDARALLEATGGRTVEVDPAVLVNVNTPEALARVEEIRRGRAASGVGDGPGPVGKGR